VACVGYYIVKGPSDFDRFLSGATRGEIKWAVRVGGWEYERSPYGESSRSFGLGIRDAERVMKVTDGSLVGTYHATYLASLRGRFLPIVLVVVRDVAPNGTSAYVTTQPGLEPTLTYFSLILLSALAAAILLEIRKGVRAREQLRDKAGTRVSNV